MATILPLDPLGPRGSSRVGRRGATRPGAPRASPRPSASCQPGSRSRQSLAATPAKFRGQGLPAQLRFEMAWGAHWWRCRNCLLCGQVPVYIVAAEAIIGTGLALLGPCVERERFVARGLFCRRGRRRGVGPQRDRRMGNGRISLPRRTAALAVPSSGPSQRPHPGRCEGAEEGECLNAEQGARGAFHIEGGQASSSQKNGLPPATAYTHEAKRCWLRTKLISLMGGVSASLVVPSRQRSRDHGAAGCPTKATATTNPMGSQPPARSCNQ